MRVAVIGIGAIGGLVSSMLCGRTDAEVLLHARRHQVESFQAGGLRLEIPAGLAIAGIPAGVLEIAADRLELSVESEQPPRRWVGACELVLVCTKSGATHAAANVAALLLDEAGHCLSLQNGIGNEEILAGRLGLRRVLGAVITHGATRLGDGSVRWAGVGELRFGPLPASDVTKAGLQAIASLFDEAGLNPVIVDDVRAQIWSKLAINAAINPLAAICGVRNGALLEDELFERASASMLEAVSVAHAEGTHLPDETEMITYLREVLISTADNRCSMLQDVMRGRVTETDSISGEVIRRGEEMGVPTPVNVTLHALVQGITRSQSLR